LLIENIVRYILMVDQLVALMTIQFTDLQDN